MMKSLVYTADFQSWHTTLLKLFDSFEFNRLLAGKKHILIKPNLVEALQPPITTPVACIAAVIEAIRLYCEDVRISVGEGSGSMEYDTWHTFDVLGYRKMAETKNIDLIDLNELPLRTMKLSHCQRWPQMHLPELLFDVFLVSVPVLKAHSLAGVTLTMKNMMGAAPPKHYQQGGHWKKASFHQNIQEAVFDLNQYRTPDFTILDATIGMQEAHLWGPICHPPHNLVAASNDPVAIDSYGASLLKRNWQDIGHIQMADGVLGNAADYTKISLDD